MNLYPYIPFYNYRTFWIRDYLNTLKTITNNKLIKDYDDIDMSWEVVEYYLGLAYNSIYFGISGGPGLRIIPTDLVYIAEKKIEIN